MSIALILHKFDCPWVSDDLCNLYSFEFVVVVAVVFVVVVAVVL